MHARGSVYNQKLTSVKLLVKKGSNLSLVYFLTHALHPEKRFGYWKCKQYSFSNRKYYKYLTSACFSVARISRITRTQMRSIGVTAQSVHITAVRVDRTLIEIYESQMRENVRDYNECMCNLLSLYMTWF